MRRHNSETGQPRGQRSLRAAAAPRPQAAPPPNRVDPPERVATGPPSPNDHAAWSPPLGPGPWSGTTPATCPGRPAGAGEHLLPPMLPRHILALDQRPCRPAGAKAAPQPGRRPSGGPGLRQPSCEPATANAEPSLPVRPDAGRQPRRPQTTAARRPAAPSRGGPPHRATPGPARRRRRGHRRPVRPDTWIHRTPGCSGRLDTGRLDTGRADAGCPLDRLDGHPHGGPDETDRATTGPGRRPDIIATGDTRWAARPRRVPTTGALGQP